MNHSSPTSPLMAVDRKVIPRILAVSILFSSLFFDPLSMINVGMATQKQDCSIQGDPPRIGPLSYTGQDGNQFEYEADAGDGGGLWFYQVAIKNTGKQPLTVEWPKPSYFRRGIPPNVIASGQC